MNLGHRTAIVLLAGAALLLGGTAACDGGGPTTPEVRATVSGTVTVEGEALPGVEVVLSGDSVRTAVTGAGGAFSFGGLVPGSYVVSLPAPPEPTLFPVLSRPVTVSASQPSGRADFQGQWKRDASIDVRVTVEGAPLAGAEIALTGPGEAASSTGSDGRALFQGLRRGPYEVTLGGFDPLLYDFAVVTRSVEAGPGAPSTVAFDGLAIPQIPLPPTDLAAAARGADVVDLVWTDASDDESHFEVERSVDGSGSWVAVATPPADATTAQDTGLEPATTYRYRVRACSVEAAGCSEWSAEALATTDDVPPAAPGEPVATPTGPTTIQVGWTDNSANEDAFVVERQAAAPGARGADRSPASAAGPWVTVAETGPDVTSLEDAGLDPASTWAYRVRACNEAGCSATTPEAVATTDPVPPPPPTELTATATGATTVSLGWSHPDDTEEGFQVERRPGAGGTWEAAGEAPAGASTFQDSGLTPDAEYVYRVRACNVAGCSAWSPEAGVTTRAVPPVAPTGLSATAAGSTAIDLAWTDAADNETGIEVHRRTGPGSWAPLVLLPPNTTELGDAGLAPGTLYRYRVRACNDAGCSTWSAEASATTDAVPPAAPTGLTATPAGTSTIDLAWTDASADETGFEIERREPAGSWSPLTTRPANLTTYSDAGLPSGVTREYRVRACNAAGCSAWSGTASATTDDGPAGPDLTIGAVYLTQGVQRLAGDAPLVAGRDGYLRVFALSDVANTLQPTVRVDFHLGGSVAHSETLAAPGSSVPTSIDESSLSTSWNVAVPGSLIQPGLAVEAVVDPGNAIAEPDETDNAFPGGGPQPLDVRDADPFRVTFVPVRQNANGTVGDVHAGNVDTFLAEARKLLPFPSDDVALRAEYATDVAALQSGSTSEWSAILSEVNALRTADGSTRHYYGVVATTYSSGIAGIGYVGWPVALGWDKLPSGSDVAAHEWGHNLNRSHSPGCGAGGPDPNYPVSTGKLDAWGLDLATLALKSPGTHSDLMTYCDPDWISAYVWEKMLDFWAPSPYVATSVPFADVAGGAPSTPPATGAAPGAVTHGETGPGLLVWGRVGPDGPVLEPAFQVTAPSALPARPGGHRVTGRDGSGRLVFSVDFDPAAVDHAAPGTGHFAFVVPLADPEAASLASIRLTTPDGRALSRQATALPAGAPPAAEPSVTPAGPGEAEVAWSPSAWAMVMVRDARTGEILSFSRDGRTRVRPPSGEVELVFSDGLRTVERRVMRWR